LRFELGQLATKVGEQLVICKGSLPGRSSGRIPTFHQGANFLGVPCQPSFGSRAPTQLHVPDEVPPLGLFARSESDLTEQMVYGRRWPEPKRGAWLAFVTSPLCQWAPMGKDIAQSGYVKPLGQGLFELRIDHDAAELAQVLGADLSGSPELANLVAEGILLRVFCTFYGDKVVLLLLSGLDKGADPKAQPRAIRASRKLPADWQAEQAAAKRRSRKR
jgi:putative component of toxin-antitoxin plasmid stabilization module